MKRRNSSAAAPDDHALPALAWLRRAHAEDELLREVAGKLRRKRARRFAAGSALLVLILAGTLASRSRWAPHQTTAVAPPPAATATISRPALQSLPDGSTIELKDDARIFIDYSAAFRRVTLVSGEAHFQVAKNQDRPFIVRAGRVEVRAVGTAFSVQLATQAVEVLVTEGSVRVSPETPPSSAASPAPVITPPPALVDAGRRCVVDRDMVPRVQDVSEVDAGERLAWRIPHLEFSRTPLPEIVALMNQHAATTKSASFEIADAGLNQIKLTGFLRADNTEGLLRLLERNFHVTAERSPDKIVLRLQR